MSCSVWAHRSGRIGQGFIGNGTLGAAAVAGPEALAAPGEAITVGALEPCVDSEHTATQ